MNNKNKVNCNNTVDCASEMMLGKRHDNSKAEEMNFKSLAISLGFSATELKTLDRIYIGLAEPDLDATSESE